MLSKKVNGGTHLFLLSVRGVQLLQGLCKHQVGLRHQLGGPPCLTPLCGALQPQPALGQASLRLQTGHTLMSSVVMLDTLYCSV